MASKADASVATRRRMASKGQAIPDKESGGRFPIESKEDLRRAIRAVGRAKPEDRAKIKQYIIRRARALGLMSMIPDDWTSGGSSKSANSSSKSNSSGDSRRSS